MLTPSDNRIRIDTELDAISPELPGASGPGDERQAEEVDRTLPGTRGDWGAKQSGSGTSRRRARRCCGCGAHVELAQVTVRVTRCPACR